MHGLNVQHLMSNLAKKLEQRLVSKAMKRPPHPLDGLADDHHRVHICDGVTNADAEAVLQQPVISHILALTQESSRSIGAFLHPDDVNEAAC